MAGGFGVRLKNKRAAQALQARAAWLLACDLAAEAFGADVRVVVQTRGVAGRGSDAVTTKARKVACWLSMTVANVAPEALAQAAKLDRKTAYAHAAWVEDMMDDPLFEGLVTGLADGLVAMATKVVMAHLRSKGAMDEAA